MTAKLGAPRKYKRGPAYLHVKIDPGLKRELERTAEVLGQTLTGAIQEAVTWYVLRGKHPHTLARYGLK